MKKLTFLVIISLCIPLVAACSSGEGPVEFCNSSYIPTCNSKQTAVVVCREGVLVEEACAAGCDAMSNTCKTAVCTSESHPRTCNAAKTGYTLCEGGVVKEMPCASGQTCNDATGLCETGSSCDISAPATCNGAVLSYCDNGTMHTETCSGATPVCDAASKSCKPNSEQPIPCDVSAPATCNGQVLSYCNSGTMHTETCSGATPVCDAASKSCIASQSGECNANESICVTPKQLRTCVDGHWQTQTCSPGSICNAEIKNKSCKVPSVGDVCNPDTFSESCADNDKSTVYCDEQTHKVVMYDCTENVGDKYRCDIAEDFNGKDLDVTMCYYTKDDDCSGPEDSYSECEYDGKDDKHYTTTYTCAKFNLGYHYYVSDVEDCGVKACNSDNTACRQ